MSQLEIEDQVQTDLQRATGLAETGPESASRLNRVLQLTGEHHLVIFPEDDYQIIGHSAVLAQGVSRDTT